MIAVDKTVMASLVKGYAAHPSRSEGGTEGGGVRRLLDKLGGTFSRHGERVPSGAAKGTAELNTIVCDLASIGRAIGAEGKRIVSTSMRIAGQSKSQRERLIDCTRVTDDIRSIAVETAEHAGFCRKNLDHAKSRLNSVGVLQTHRTDLMDELFERAAESSASLREVNAAVQQVERFLGVIDGIRNQTSMLALNAAIEAARAGEQGRGFQVVAGEMSALAERTQVATQQIRSMTEAMRASTNATVDAIEKTCESSDLTRKQALLISESLQACDGAMATLEQRVAEVAGGAARQMAATKNLHDHVSTVGELARETAFEADSSAETSMGTLQLASRFHDGLRSFGEFAGGSADGQTAHPWIDDLNAFDAEAKALAAPWSRLDELRPQLLEGMQMLQARCRQAGNASRRGKERIGEQLPELFFGVENVNFKCEQVDSVIKATGLSASLFVLAVARDGERGLYCVATNIQHSNGSRATGTKMNPKGLSALHLLEGQPYAGNTYILGRPFHTMYAPIVTAAGETIGAFYVGKAMHAE